MFFKLILALFVVSCRSQAQDSVTFSKDYVTTLPPASTTTTLPPSPAPTTQATTTQAPPAPLPQPARQCAEAGQICATCDTVSICISNGDGTITTVNQTCHSDENCVEGLCVQGALCNYRPFECSEEGFFPDPYDCTKYQVCLPTGADGNADLMTFDCPEGTSYDALSASCGFPLDTEACLTRPVPDCTERLQVGAVPSNPNLYYTCLERDNTLAPELRKCSGGNKFKADKLSCKEELGKKDKKEKKEKKPKKPKKE